MSSISTVFLDINVILDGITKRPTGNAEASVLLDLANRGELSCVTAASSWLTVFYVVSRMYRSRDAKEQNRQQRSHTRANALLRKYLPIVTIQPVTSEVLNAALLNSMVDFEDAVQYETARAASADFLITSDLDGFPLTQPRAIDVSDYLATHWKG